MPPQGFEDKVAFVWRIADKLRGTFKQHEFGSVMLPLLVLRRMDAALAPTRDAVLAKAATFDTIGQGQAMQLRRAAGQRFYNTSPYTFASLLSLLTATAAQNDDVGNRHRGEAGNVEGGRQLRVRV